MNNKQRFGKLREAYVAGRRGYPQECIDYLVSLIGKERRVLDLGCGTGIATRQLAQIGLAVVGADSDEKMLEKAREHKGPAIEYTFASAEHLPFQDNEFDTITAFGAFHWFCDKKSVAEIKRVLNERGTFIAVNKNDNDRFRRTYRRVLRDFAELPPSVKRGYNPLNILKNNGFHEITRKVFEVTEVFTLDDAITHVKSRGTWNHIPPKSYKEATKKLRESFSRIYDGGKIRRTMEVAVIHGKK